MKLKNWSFQNETQKLKFPIWKIPISLLTARSVTSVSCVLCPLSQNLSWSRALCRMSILGTTELMFIEPGVKINGAYYRRLAWSAPSAGDSFCSRILLQFPTVQCSRSPSWWHRGVFFSQYTRFHLTVAVAAQIPNSPDLNPVDHEVWGVLQQRVYCSRICDVDQLKHRLIEEWHCFDQNIIDRAVRQ